jgi:hypothetical protein
MKDRNEANVNVIELGTVSGDTLGDRGTYWESFALQPRTGISDD